MHTMIRYFLTITVLCCYTQSYAQRSWTKHAGNPVVPEWSGNIDDPSSYKYCLEPGVLYDSAMGVYRMWFVSLAYGFGTRFNISEAISFDGMEWYGYMKNPRLSRGGDLDFDQNVRSPKVIYDGQEYKMYYSGENAGKMQIGLATSSDGKSWDRSSGNPVLTPGPGSWDSASVAFCDVYFDGSQYSMWYTGGDAVTPAIGLAMSSDGLTWTKYAGNPVFTKNQSGWDRDHVVSPSVVRVDQRFYMFYVGDSIPTCCSASIGWAHSIDGINWVRGDSLPILTHENGWEGVSLGGLSAVFQNNKFHLWYSGLSSQTGHWQTGYATSDYIPLGVEHTPPAAPRQYYLYQSYPNPFNPDAAIEYDLPKRSYVTLKIYNSIGQQVAVLADEWKEAGHHSVVWNINDRKNFASGVLWYKITAGEYSDSKKMILAK